MPEWFIQHSELIAQFIGVIAMTLGIIAYQWNNRKKILFMQLISSIFWSLQFLVLGAYTGMILNVIGVLRCIVFAYKDKRWAANKIWVAVFVVASLVSGISTWENAWSLLPVMGMVMSTFSSWMTNPKILRRLSLPGSVCWFIYNIPSHAYVGALNEIFVTSSIIIAMIRYDRTNRKSCVQV